MASVVERFAGFVLRHLKKAASRSTLLRKLRYDMSNAENFSNLYQHEQMLADTVRVNTYREGIRRHVKPGDVVVDLGTGTGILSFLAAAQGPRVIYALDHSDFISIARRIARHNKIDNITFLQANSRTFVPPEKADVVIHEQIGDALLNENMIDNLLDLKQRILKPTGRIVPGKFELFFEPVSLRKEFRVPYIWENRIHGVDFGFLRDDAEIARYERDTHHCRTFASLPVDYFLCEPVVALTVDLNGWTPGAEPPSRIDLSRTVVRAGSMDGLCLYFRVIFDDEISFDTSPLSTHTHWDHRFFRTRQQWFNEGDAISYTVDFANLLDPKQWRLTFK